MALSHTNFGIMNKLVGPMDEGVAQAIINKTDCFFHPQLSIYIPTFGQCDYAIRPSHTHPAYSFIYYFQPITNFIVNGEDVSHDISDGKCLSALSPDIPHQETEEDTFQSYIAILVDKEFFDEIISQYIQPVPVFYGEIFTPHPELLGLLRCFMLEAGKGGNNNHNLLDCLVPTITHYIVRSIIPNKQTPVHLYDRFEVDKAIAYMNSHFSNKITIEILADHVNLSTGYFTKIFKSVTGATPIDFLNSIRLQKARHMLVHHMDNLTEIALKCGFNTSSYFSYCFIEKYKMTPSSYRQIFSNKCKF